jgi:hypothetical protein
MKIDGERHVNISSVCNFYGTDVCNVLPAFHSLTGCDTTLYPFGCGNIKPFKKMLQHKKHNLIASFGLMLGNGHQVFNDAVNFFQTVIYNGLASESLV